MESNLRQDRQAPGVDQQRPFLFFGPRIHVEMSQKSHFQVGTQQLAGQQIVIVPGQGVGEAIEQLSQGRSEISGNGARLRPGCFAIQIFDDGSEKSQLMLHQTAAGVTAQWQRPQQVIVHESENLSG